MKQNSEPKGRIYDLQARIANAFIISERSDGRQIIQKGFKAFPLNQNLYSILNYKARIHILGYQLSHFLLTNIEIFRCFIPRMNYPQYRKARKLTHECCNYCDGNCLLLDDGEECVCVQSISYSLLCRWFRAAVLPLDGALYAEIIQSRDSVKRCAVCGAAFTPKSNRAKYCPDCAVRMRRKQEAERQRKRYLQATQLSR